VIDAAVCAPIREGNSMQRYVFFTSLLVALLSTFALTASTVNADLNEPVRSDCTNSSQNDAGSPTSTLPVPLIAFQGKPVPNSGEAIEVVIGQVIDLSANKSGTTDLWSFCPSAIVYRTFEPKVKCPPSPAHDTEGCANYGNVDLHSSKTELYFVEPGAHEIRYSYSQNGKSASASINVNVVAPSLPDAPTSRMHHVTLGPIGCSIDCVEMTLGQYISFPIIVGVQNNASVVPPAGFLGDYFWLQIVDDSITYTDSSGSHQCKVLEGLDGNTFPYSRQYEIHDTPYYPLKGLIGVSRTFAAFDTLMWQAKILGSVQRSVPVALGSITWGFYGNASYISDAGKSKWILSSRSETEPQFHPGWYAVGWDAYVPLGEDRPGPC
jgi:hypothetical protein